MTGVAEGIEAGSYAAARGSITRYAPFNNGIEDSAVSPRRSRSGAVAVLVALLLLSGVTVAVAKGSASAVESYGGSPEGLLSIAWVVQGAIALLCFLLAVRWLRS